MKRLLVFFFIILLMLVSACVGGYSFTGASVSADVKTFSVENFVNRASIVQPILASEMTYALTNKIKSSTNLTAVDYDGDLSFKGIISGYTVTPTAISSNDQATQNRLTITIKVEFINKKNPKANFTQSFSRFKNYDSQLSLSEVEENLISEINSELIDDIFNKALVNW
ncbi:MAG: LPS assembly lipoprotein LptE [Bacteroidales bacterium]|nr:LPS assembly lipoprotein LptE [Bacteroidales bacterium]